MSIFLSSQKQLQHPKLFWVHGSVDFNNTPFSIGEKNVSIVNTATITSKISKQRVKKFACKGVAKLDAQHT